MSDFEFYKLQAQEKQAQYDELPKHALSVRLEMATPFSTTQHVRLDSVIARFGLIAALGDAFFNLPEPTGDNMIHAPCPLDRCENDAGQWWWSCSFGVPSLHRDQIARWKKRWDDEHDDVVSFEGKLPRVDHKAGFFKAYDMPLVIKNAREVLFCCVGNGAEVERLLSGLRYIGKKRSQGYGEIRRVCIEETDENWSNYRDGKATRAIPLGISDEQGLLAAMHKYGGLAYTTYRPPYWFQPWATWCLPIWTGKHAGR